MYDLRILNATLVTEAETFIADIGIEGSTIAEVGPQGSLSPSRMDVDGDGLYAMPGAVDVHFHCRAPSHPERGDFGSETAAAAAGGVTTVFEMPISEPACSTPEVFEQRRSLAEAQAFVNVALYAGAAVDAAQAQEMAELGAIAFKLFTIAPAPGRETEFAGLWATGDGDVFDALTSVGPTGLRCVVHAESDSLLARLKHSNWAEQRPPAAESVAIVSTAALAKEAGAPIHIAHLSSRSAVAAVRGGIMLGADLTAETCPQYLLLDDGTVERFGGLAKIGPPLRPRADAEALWEAIADGTIGIVASDHAPFLPEEKLAVDYASAPMGLPTVELLVPGILDAAARGRLSLEAAVGLVTAAPARLFGLEGQKGSFAVGADADIALFSLGSPRHLRADEFHTRAKGCAVVFEGLQIRARVERTIVAGALVFADGQIVGEPQGRFLPGSRIARQPEPA